MRFSKPLILLLLSMTVSLPLITVQGNHGSFSMTSSEGIGTQTPESDGLLDSKPSRSLVTDSFALSQDTVSGAIDPARVRHSGYQVSDMLRARTDSGTNTKRNVTIDESNGWFASQAEVEVNNPRRLYAYNGTFDRGTSPWTNSTYDPSIGLQTQTANYDVQGQYVDVENTGEPGSHPVLGDYWTHYQNSEILWSQTIDNTPYSSSFLLSFDFLYASGPLDPSPYDLVGDAQLVVYIHNNVYYLSLLETDDRSTWYYIRDYLVTPAALPSSFEFAIGLYIDLDDLALYSTGDYDDDSVEDGAANAEKIEVWLDSVALDSVSSPSFEEVDMRFRSGGLEVIVTGTGTTGSATITYPSFWTTDPVQVEVIANTSISFDYKVTLLMHQYENSSWTPDPTKPGVSYTMTQGESAHLRAYTYIAASYGYENITIDIEHPADWENVTVLDPLLNDLTAQCDVNESVIGIPNSLLDRVGWWEIRLDGPNYAEGLIAQKYSTATGQWSEDSLFRAGNETRVHAELGTATNTPAQGQPAEISWLMPNGTLWAEESIEAMVDGAFNGTSLTLGGENTTAGRWALELFWTNGTEIAFAAIGFDMYHASSLTATQSVIETEVGSIITGIVRYIDTDNGEYLMQETALIAANWSSITVTYDPNLVRSWWEADFDTSVVGGGEFTIVANASQPYYDEASCQFIVRAFYQTVLDVTSVGGTLATTSYLENYTFYLSYTFANDTPVNGADITMEYTGPSSGILPLGWGSLGGGNYSFSLKGIACGLYAVTVTAAKEYHYSASDTFTLLVVEANTVLSSLNGTSGLVRMGETYRLVVHYENSSGGGMAGASVVVDEVTPGSGLTYGGFAYTGNGDYYIDLTPALATTYTLVIRASMTNYVERVVTFTLTAIVTPTVLTVSTSGATMTMNQTYTVQLLLVDDESNPVLGAAITVLNPPSGLLFHDYVPLPGGLYNVTITPLDVGTYQMAFRASRENCLNSTVGFVLVASYVPTSLSVQHSGSLVTTGLYENLVFYLIYEMLNGTPVQGASLVMNHTGSEDGLVFTGQTYLGLGNYSFTLRGIQAGLYTVTLTGTKEYLYPASDSFTLLVIETGTTLSALNGTSGMVKMGQIFRFAVHYENSSGGALSGANVVLESITPSSGLVYGSFAYAGNGDYYIDLTPEVATTYTLMIRASLYNHVERVVAFTLTAMETPTVLTVSTSGANVAIDQTYTVQLYLTDDESNPVVGASITALNPPSGLIFQSYVPLLGGLYNVTIQSLQTGTYQIAFRASCENYENSTVGFTLIVGYIPTSLDVLGGASSDSVLFAEDCEITVVYLRTDLNRTIEGADFAVSSAPETGFTWQVTNTTGGYQLRFMTNATGIWMIFISSNKAGYVEGFVQFELEVTRIPASINEISLVDDLVYGRVYNFTFNYIMSNGTGIEGATYSVSGPGAQWTEITETDSGRYQASMTPRATGSYTVTLVFEREGCDPKSSILSFVVVPASMSIVDVEGLDSLEGENTTLSVRLIESNTGQPIVGASVTFQIVTSTGPGDIAALQETSPGTYAATFMMSSFGTSDRIRIYASLDNYELDVEAYEAFLDPLPSESAQLGRTIRQVSPFVFILMASVFGLSLQSVSAGRRRRRNIKALSTKRRFDDMKSLIGVIVMHKDSGIPVFSKILKSGLDESLISGFISAVSSFRMEFGVDQAEGGIIPISDIIRVVKTKNLLCAFITLGPPSDSQQEKLLRFTKSVGLMFDSIYDTPPTGIVDHELLARYETLFDDLMDGHLLDDYRYTEDTKPPRSLRQVGDAVGRLENPDKFGLEPLAREMSYRDLEETMVYMKIVEAIEKHYLVPLPRETSVVLEAVDVEP